MPDSKSKSKTKKKNTKVKKARLPKKVAGSKKTAKVQTRDPLALIALGEFERAMKTLSPSGAAALSGVADVFNYAAAQWGKTGKLPKDLFQRAFKLAEAEQYDSDNASSANFHQCLALAAGVSGNLEAARAAIAKSRRLLESGPAKEFSAWRFRDVTRTTFLSDLEAIESLLEDSAVVPVFIAGD